MLKQSSMKKIFRSLIRAALFIASIATTSVINAQVISTVAGSGGTGFGGDGYPATTAAISNAMGVAVDRSGNFYISDNSNNRVRKVDVSGIINTIAGNGVSGYSGDGGAATDAEISGPFGVAVDTAGNVYFADNGNNCIRVVSTSGIISTYAGISAGGFAGDGGAATAARISSPEGICLDNLGNLFVADNGNARVRKIDASHTITTVAGNGSTTAAGDGGAATAAAIGFPEGVAVDHSGNLYIAAPNTNTVRMVSTSGIITTITGNGVSGLTGDGGPATAAEIAGACGVAVDGGGNVYIADSGNEKVRVITPAGMINTYAGSSGFGWSGDGSAATAATLNNPHALAVDAYNNLYVTTLRDNKVRFIDSSAITYCVPTFSEPAYGCTYDGYGIMNFYLVGSSSVLSDGTPCDGTGYKNFYRSDSVVLQQGNHYSLLLTVGSYFYSTKTVTWVDFNDNGIFENDEIIGSISSFVGFDTCIYTVPATGLVGFHRMRILVTDMLSGTSSFPYLDPCADGYTYGEVRDYKVRITAAPECTGTPSAGVAVSDISGTCSGSPFTLSLAGATIASGMTYQWQSSPDSSTWSDILGATSATMLTTETETQYYRCDVACFGTSGSSFSSGTMVAYLGACYSIPFFSRSSPCGAVSYSIGEFQVLGDSSTSIVDTNACDGMGYENRTSLSCDLSLGANYTVTVTTNTSGTLPYQVSNQVWIDFNDNGVYEATESVGGSYSYGGAMPSQTTDVLSIPVSSNIGVHRMRIVQDCGLSGYGYEYPYILPSPTASDHYYYGEARDYSVNIITPPTCTGTPVAGIAQSTVGSVCDSEPIILYVTGCTVASSLTWQWQSSADTATWTDISGATSPTITTSETATSYYRCVVTCTATTLSAHSNIVRVDHNAACYCTPSFSMSYFSCTTYDFSVGVFRVLGDSSTIINDSMACNGTGYEDRTLLSCVFRQAGTYVATLVSNVGFDTIIYNHNTQVWIDFDDDGTFEYSETIGGMNELRSESEVAEDTLRIPAYATPGRHRMRIVQTYAGCCPGTIFPSIASCPDSSVYSYGEARDYTVYIGSCPVPSVAAISGSYEVCAGSSTPLYDSTVGGTWSSSDATVATVSAGGVLTGMSAGVAFITYAVSNTCGTTTALLEVEINATAAPSSIAGAATVCTGDTTRFTDSTTGGAWSCASTGIATVAAGGLVYGVAAGTAVVSYTVSDSCGTATVTETIGVTGAPSAGVITGSATVCSGGSTTLSDSVAGGTWASADDTVAIISASGAVTGIEMGVDVISYTVTGACGTTTTTTTITVVNTATVAGIAGPDSICTGGTAVYTDSTSGGTWLSSSAAIATVDSGGVVTAVSPGTVSLAYYVTDSCGVATATKLVTVYTPVAGVITGSSTVAAGATTTLGETVTGGVWSSSNTALATVNAAGVVTGIAPGTDTITYTVTTSCGILTATMVITITPATGVPGTMPGGGIDVYPNPTNSTFTVTFPADTRRATCSIAGVDGKILFMQETTQPSLYIDLRKFAAGTYLLTVEIGQQTYNRKVVLR